MDKNEDCHVAIPLKTIGIKRSSQRHKTATGKDKDIKEKRMWCLLTHAFALYPWSVWSSKSPKGCREFNGMRFIPRGYSGQAFTMKSKAQVMKR